MSTSTTNSARHRAPERPSARRHRDDVAAAPDGPAALVRHGSHCGCPVCPPRLALVRGSRG